MANWLTTFLQDIASLWSLKEIRIFVWVLIIGTILYFSLTHLHEYFLRLGKGVKKGYAATKQDLQNKAFMLRKEQDQGIRKERNFEVYRELVLWTEKPLFIWKVPQTKFERSIYGIIIGLLFILILWRVLW